MGVCVRIIAKGTEGWIETKNLNPALITAISEQCAFEPEGAEFMKRNNRHWDGKRRLFNRQTRKFPLGLLPRVTRIAESHGNSVEFVSRDRYDHIAFPTIDYETWALRPYQVESLNQIIKARRCMAKLATGAGKTPLAGWVMSQFGLPSVFLVHTQDLLYQALTTFRSMFGNDFVGQIGDGVVAPREGITVCTIQTASRIMGTKYTSYNYSDGDDSWLDKKTEPDSIAYGVLANAGTVIMDECHRVAAPTAIDLLAQFSNAVNCVGFSASPWRDDGAELALEGAFGDVACDVPASDLIEDGYLVAPVIRFASVPPMRFDKGTKYSTIYEGYVVNNPIRNTIGVDAAMRKINKGLCTLTLVRHISHGIDVQERFRAAGMEIPFLSGKDDSKLRNSVLNDMRADRLPGLIATTIADEGLDVKPLAGLVLLGGGKSSTRALQRIGRVLRPYPGKMSADVTDFNDQAKFLIDHSHARRKMYESESMFTVIG